MGIILRPGGGRKVSDVRIPLAKQYGRIRASLAEKVPLSCQSNSESRKTQSTGMFCEDKIAPLTTQISLSEVLERRWVLYIVTSSARGGPHRRD